MTQLLWEYPLATGCIVVIIILMLVWVYNNCCILYKKSSIRLTRQDVAKQFAKFEPEDLKIANLLYDLGYNKAIQRWYNMLLHLERRKNNPCINDNCYKCSGTGIKQDGSACMHRMICSCPKCAAKYGVKTYESHGRR